LEKSGMIIGGLLGATVVLLVFAFIMVPPPSITSPALIVTNGHGPSTVGEETPIAAQRELSLTEIFEQAEEGVVRINVEKRDDAAGRNGVGSGFVFDKNGDIITNAHVVANANKVVVTFLDGRSYNAEIIGSDPFTDIAVVRVTGDPDLIHPLPIGDSSKMKVGMRVAAIGNPFGLSGSMTAGIVSQLGRLLPLDSGFSIPDVIQTDAAINPGNSGGPLLNMKGEVIGINTAIQSASGEFSGIGFAIPSNTAAKIVPKLIEDGKYHHPWVGIAGRDIDPNLATILNLKDARGFLIITVVENSPAAKAGLQGSSDTQVIDGISYPVGGDVVLSVDGKPVRKIDDILIHLQREKSVGDEMVLEILRNGRTTNVVILLEERPNSN
jgi:S1-C subfamily serine protease